MTLVDQNVDDFLDRVKELDERRKLEDKIRREKLRAEVESKKLPYSNDDENGYFSYSSTKIKPIVPKKSSSLAKIVNGSSGMEESVEGETTLDDDIIQLVRPIGSKHNGLESVTLEKDLVVTKAVVDSESPIKENSMSLHNMPQPLKFKDTQDVARTVERLVGHDPKRNVKYIKPKETEVITIDSDEEGKLKPKEKLKLKPEVKPKPEVKSKPEVKPKPIKSGSSSPSRVARKPIAAATNHYGLFIPKPDSVTAVSAVAAAKAPKLKSTITDVGEREPDLATTARYLIASKPERIDSPIITRTIPPKKKEIKPMEKQIPLKEKPEALQKLTKLKPPVPTRKPSYNVPEALSKFNSLKKTETLPIRGMKVFEKEKEDLLANSRNTLRKIDFKSPQRAHTAPESTVGYHHENSIASMASMASMAPVRLPFADRNAKYPFTKASSFDSEQLQNNKVNEKLIHTTKTRSKGPKRKLPSALRNNSTTSITSNTSTTSNTSNTSTKTTQKSLKKPPPIKSSSRVVSAKLENKRVFSNSEIFI